MGGEALLHQGPIHSLFSQTLLGQVFISLFGFQMLFFSPSQHCHIVQTWLHLLVMFLCKVDVL